MYGLFYWSIIIVLYYKDIGNYIAEDKSDRLIGNFIAKQVVGKSNDKYKIIVKLNNEWHIHVHGIVNGVFMLLVTSIFIQKKKYCILLICNIQNLCNS